MFESLGPFLFPYDRSDSQWNITATSFVPHINSSGAKVFDLAHHGSNNEENPMAQHVYLYNMTSRWQQSVALRLPQQFIL